MGTSFFILFPYSTKKILMEAYLNKGIYATQKVVNANTTQRQEAARVLGSKK